MQKTRNSLRPSRLHRIGASISPNRRSRSAFLSAILLFGSPIGLFPRSKSVTCSKHDNMVMYEHERSFGLLLGGRPQCLPVHERLALRGARGFGRMPHGADFAG